MGRKGLSGRIGVSEATLIHQHSAVSFAHVVSPLPTFQSSCLPCLHFALFNHPSTSAPSRLWIWCPTIPSLRLSTSYVSAFLEGRLFNPSVPCDLAEILMVANTSSSKNIAWWSQPGMRFFFLLLSPPLPYDLFQDQDPICRVFH